MSKIYVTQEGLEKLQQELIFLKNEKRVEIAEKLKEAISFWDLSENSEYEDARSEQAQVELRITELTEQLKNIEVIEEWKTKGKISIGSEVEIQNIDSKEKDTLKIVGTTEADILAEPKLISNESPLGKVLLGKKKWSNIKVKALGWSYEYKILAIK